MRFPVPPFKPADKDPCFCRSGHRFDECCGSRLQQRRAPAGVQIFPGFLDIDTCQKWVKRFEKQPRLRSTTTDRDATRKGGLKYVEDPARVCHNVVAGTMRTRIIEAIKRGYLQALGDSGHKLAWFEMPNILRYEPGGFYLHHADSCLFELADRTWYKVQDRDLSMLIYLNDDFTGGGLTFVKFNFHYRPRIGDLLVFPSDNRYEHQAEKVESGIRYCIASWAALEGTRKVFNIPPKDAVLL